MPETLNSYPPVVVENETFRSSKRATVWVVSLAIFVDMVTYGIVMPTIPSKIMEKFHLDASFVGLLLAFYAIGLLVMTPLIGVYSYHYRNRKIPMLIGLGGLIGTTLLFAYSTKYWGLCLARFGQGVSAGISWTIGFSMISDIYKPSELGSISGWVLTANTLGFLVGPPLGGLLTDTLGEESPYLFCTALALVDLAGRLYIQPRSIEQSPTEVDRLLSPVPIAEHPSPVKSSFFSLLSDVQVIVSCLGIIIAATVFSGIEPTLPIHLVKNFQMGATAIGLLWMAIVIPNMIAGILAGNLSDRYGRKNITALGLLLLALTSPLMAYSESLFLLIVSLMLFGASASIALTPGLPEMAEFTEERGGGIYAQAYALYNMSYSVGMLVGPLLGGWLFDAFGFTTQMNAFAILCSLCAPWVLYFYIKRQSHALV